MKLLAVLVGNDGAGRGSCVGGDLDGGTGPVSWGLGGRYGYGVVRTTTPPSYIHPTIVVPVLVALGKGMPLA